MADSVELEIRIGKAEGRRHRATVVRGLRAGGGSFFELPEDGGLPAGEGDWRDLRRPSAKNDEALFSLLMKQGRALFELVFTGEVYVAFVDAYGSARENGRWFRLQFSFEQAPEAMDLPWEVLVAKDGNALALLPQVSIERRLIASPSMETPRLTDGKLRALIAGALPPGFEKLDVDRERKWIKAAFAKSVETRLLEHTSLSSLGKELSSGAPFDLVHFIGHGDFEGDEGGLWLEDESGRGVRLTGHDLPAMLRRPVSFVFLNVCSGGRSSANPFAGLAEALLRSGVRAVVAMRREISDPGAVALAKNFYKCIAAGETLTRALAKARTNVVHTHTGDWAVPMLYLAAEDFALLPAAPPAPIGKLLSPKLDTEAPAGLAATLSPRPRRFFGPPGKEGSSLAKRAVALALLLVMVVFGMWYVWPPAPEPKVEPPAPAPDPPAQPDENSLRCPSPKNIPIAFIYVPAGKTFRQGEDLGDDDFGPQHEVTLTRDFCLARNETTRGLWAQVLGSASPPVSEAKLPRTYITKEDAVAFLQLLNKLDPAGQYRLPTEAEWEYAARAGSTTVFSFGDDARQLSKYGNCLNDDRPQSAMPVGSLKPNPWGFNDMHGNVWEWVADDWTSYTPAAKADPVGKNPRSSPVRRGGAYDSKAENCWSAARKNIGVSKKMKTVGFRIARTPVR